MSDTLRLGRRALTIGVAVATIAWAIGLTTLVAPLTARAVDAGTLIKGSLPAVYYYAADGKRYVFPNEKTFSTWYADFSGVQVLTDAEIADIPIGDKNVVYRAGTRLVKIQTDPRVYALEPDGLLRWVESEAVAVSLYGADWAVRVDDVPDVFFVDYAPGASLADASAYPAGSLVSAADSDDVYYISDASTKRLVSAMDANRFQAGFVIETSQNLDVYTAGDALAAADATLTDTAQTDVVADTTTTGGLTIATATDTPAGITLAQGASSVELFAFNATATSGDATISGIILKRFGVGAQTDWSNLYIYENGTRLTDGRTVNSQTQLVSFSGLAIAVASGTTKRIVLRGDLGTSLTSGGTHGFQVLNADAVTSTASAVSGSFPVAGNQFTTGSATAGTLTLDAVGSPANPTLGANQAEIARFTMNAATEDISITRIQFRVDGTIRYGDLTNLKLKQGSTVVAEAAGMTTDGNYIVMAFTTPYLLENGYTRTFNLYGDVGGEATRTIGIRIRNAADVLATGSIYQQNVQINVNAFNGGTGGATADSGTCSATGQDCTFTTVQGSTLTYAFNGPSSANIAVSSQDVVFMNFSITAQQYTLIDQFSVIVRCDAGSTCAGGGGLLNATDQNLKDIKISEIGGGIVMGPQELTFTSGDDTTQTLSFTEDLVLQAGETRDLQITADIDSEATAADVFEVIVDVSTITAEDANGDTVLTANIIPSADIVGNNMTIQSASLTVNLSLPPSDGSGQTTIKGATAKDSVGFSFAAGQGSDITMTALTLSTYVSSTVATADSFTERVDAASGNDDAVSAIDMVNSVSLYDANTGLLVSGPENVRSASGNVVFDNFVWDIPAGQTKKLVARASYANYTVDITDDLDGVAFRIDLLGDITAQDADGTTVDATLTTGNGTTTQPIVYVRLTNSGSLAATADADRPRGDIVLAGATDVAMLKVRFDATNEGFLIDRMRVMENGSNDMVGSAGTYDNNISAVKLSYPKQDGSTGTATGFFVSGVADFTLATGEEMYVAANSYGVLSILNSFQTIENGATRGEQPTMMLDPDASFQAKGVSSGTTVTNAGTTDVDGNAMVLYETEPTISLAAGSPTTGVAGAAEVLRFTVAAAAGEAVVLDMITFKIISTDNNGADTTDWNDCTGTTITTGDFTLYDRAAPSTALESADTDWSLLLATGAACSGNGAVLGFARLDLTDPELIAAGTTKTFSLYFDTTGASTANDDTVRVEIPAEPLVGVASFLAASTINGNITQATNTVTVDDVDASAALTYAIGDLICMSDAADVCDTDDEIMFVTAVNATDDELTVDRGILATTPAAITDAAQHVRRIASGLVWDDDGNVSSPVQISGDLIANLPVVGATFVY